MGRNEECDNEDEDKDENKTLRDGQWFVNAHGLHGLNKLSRKLEMSRL